MFSKDLPVYYRDTQWNPNTTFQKLSYSITTKLEPHKANVTFHLLYTLSEFYHIVFFPFCVGKKLVKIG
jgi:hypothetical protein